jgi:ATP-dependent DNA helicase RecQ
LGYQENGKQHQESKQKSLDEKRDYFLRRNKWEVVRIPASEVREDQISSQIRDISELFQKDSFLQSAVKSLTHPLPTYDAGQAALQLVITPLAIARLQWSVVWALRNGYLDLQKPALRIAVIEWDLPCGFLALWDLLKSINHLKEMTGVRETFPRIELEIFRTTDLGLADGIGTLEASGITVHVSRGNEFEHLRKDQFDMIVSVSVLQVGSRDVRGLIGQNPCITVDSVYSPRCSSAHIESADPIQYRLDQQLTEPPEGLNYLLQWIFRKRKFRDGQFQILKKSLTLRNVIGLLPPSGGKSLCYQLSALLQPGITIVVDPLISLMADQVDNLKRLEIDAVGCVSSDQNREEYDEALQRLLQRNVLMFLISPERLQIPSFREQLKRICQTTPVPYLVIDEAHCISEWGHDFRPSYLKLADNGRKYCTYAGRYRPQVIALTGTASTVVLSDIQRATDLKDDAIVTLETFDRSELEFQVKPCSSHQKWPKLKERLLQLPNLFHKPQEQFFNPQNAGIIFCPHVRWTYSHTSIEEVKQQIDQELKQLIPDVRMFGGRPATGYRRKDWMDLKRKNQRDFKENKVALMVATKSFGMGIDKLNIRYTIHYNMPTSLEAFYQEAGRAGRDMSPAVCTLIYSGDTSKWQRTFYPNVSVEEVRNEVDSTSQRDDIYRMLWFHSKNWDGVDNEFKEIKGMIDSTFQPAIMNLKSDETTIVKIPFEGELVLESEDDDSRTRIERRLYRLSILGLVVDYGLDHNARMFEVEVARRDDDYFKSVLMEYIGRYKPAEYAKRFLKRIEGSSGTTMLEKCLKTLLEFVYEEIETKRRRMILQMAEVAESPDDKAFKDAIIRYLDRSEFTKKLDDLSRQLTPQEWVDISSNIGDIDSAKRLLGGCRRALESYPDHPGLLLLSWFARQRTSDKTAMDEFERATRSLANSPLDDSVQEQTLARMLEQVAVDQPDTIPALCYVALQEFPRREIARIALAYSEVTSKTGEVALRVLLGYTHQKVQTVRRHIVGGDRN